MNENRMTMLSRRFEINELWGSMTEPNQSGNECGRCGHRPGRNEGSRGCRTCRNSPDWLARVALARNRGDNVLLLINASKAYTWEIDIEWVVNTFFQEDEEKIAILRNAGDELREFYLRNNLRIVEYYSNSMNAEFINMLETCNRGDIAITIGSVYGNSIDYAARKGCSIVTFWPKSDELTIERDSAIYFVDSNRNLPLLPNNREARKVE
jgi:hypothetical protein